MHKTARLFGTPAQFSKPLQGFNRARRRIFERQWHRQHAQQAHRPQIETRQPLHVARRHASTVSEDARSAGTRTKNFLYGSVILVVLGFGYLYVTDTRAGIHQWFVVPSLRLIYPDAEDAHHAGAKALKALWNFNLHPRERGDRDGLLSDLRVEVFGHALDNPVGTSAGIDKNGELPSQLLALGPAIVEVGGVTAVPQEGNPKPRVFRLPSQNALINRYGLNSEGADNVAARLRQRVREFAFSLGLGLGPEGERAVLNGELGVPPGSLTPGKLMAVQVAKNKDTPDGDIEAIAKDYEYCVDRLAPYADILVVNVSSPNTPGLRSLQATKPLTAILTAVVDAAHRTDRRTKPAVMVKVSPDEDSDSQIDGICSAVWASGVDGIIVGNTTKKRPDTIPQGFIVPEEEERLLTEMGGYSGPQMFERTLDLVKRYRSRLDAGPSDGSKPPQPQKTPTQAASDGTPDPADASVQRDLQRLKPDTAAAAGSSSQPLIQLPERHTSTPLSASSPTSTSPGLSTVPATPLRGPGAGDQKVIFATGGITNGKQCLQVLNAGASICQIYTTMMYGGVGTITRIKSEMREEMRKKGGS